MTSHRTLLWTVGAAVVLFVVAGGCKGRSQASRPGGQTPTVQRVLHAFEAGTAEQRARAAQDLSGIPAEQLTPQVVKELQISLRRETDPTIKAAIEETIKRAGTPRR